MKQMVPRPLNKTQAEELISQLREGALACRAEQDLLVEPCKICGKTDCKHMDLDKFSKMLDKQHGRWNKKKSRAMRELANHMGSYIRDQLKNSGIFKNS